MVFNKDRYQALFDSGLDFDLEWRDLSVKVYGTSAVSNAYLYGTIRQPGGTIIQTPHRNTVTWVKDGGKWQVVQFHTSELKPDVQGTQELISRYHKAIVDRDLKTARACLGSEYTRAFRQAGVPDDPKRWAGGYSKAEDIDEWLGNFTTAEVTYENAIEFLHASLTEESGVVVTRETGSFTSPEQSGSWEGVINLWWVARMDGAWKIVGSVHNLQ
ncbi:MAG: nuclear transport factor 2 family protein [Candidatus Latescibacteria bacterium]|nr:nuclear transport factor 2 family protein [Candidatus Latescibacterota bacterium]